MNKARMDVCPRDKVPMKPVERKDYPNLLTYECPKCKNWYSYPFAR